MQNRHVICRRPKKHARFFGRCFHMASRWLKMVSNRPNISHMIHFAAGGHIKAPWDISKTPRNNNFPKRIKFVRPNRNLSSRCVFAQREPTKMHLILFDPGDPSLSLACHLYLRSLASFTSARLLPSLLLACCLCFCSLAAFTSARWLPLLSLACFRYFFLWIR